MCLPTCSGFPGLRFVWDNSLLPSLALVVGAWGLFNQTAMVVQILFVTRTLGLTEQPCAG